MPLLRSGVHLLRVAICTQPSVRADQHDVLELKGRHFPHRSISDNVTIPQIPPKLSSNLYQIMIEVSGEKVAFVAMSYHLCQHHVSASEHNSEESVQQTLFEP